MTGKPKHLSLFTGYGGIDIALHRAFGAETVAVADIDKGAKKILAHRYPNVPNLGDVTRVDWSEWAGKVDIVSGGSPCQDLSSAGKRRGMQDGTRSNLWVAMRDAIAEIKPALVVWENVRGAFSARAESAAGPLEYCEGCVGTPPPGTRRKHRPGQPHLRALGRVLGDLSDLGYDAWWYGFPASDAGAAHRRFRVFVFAVRADANSVGCEGEWRVKPVKPDVDGCGGAGEVRGAVEPSSPVTLLPTPTANLGQNGGGQHPDKRRAGGHGVSIEDAAHAMSLTDWGEYAAAVHRQERAFGIDAPSPVELGERGNLRLSARFSEWLMGLEPGWITDVPGITRSEALRAAGNGVVPQQCYEACLRFLDDYMMEGGVLEQAS